MSKLSCMYVCRVIYWRKWVTVVFSLPSVLSERMKKKFDSKAVILSLPHSSTLSSTPFWSSASALTDWQTVCEITFSLTITEAIYQLYNKTCRKHYASVQIRQLLPPVSEVRLIQERLPQYVGEPKPLRPTEHAFTCILNDRYTQREPVKTLLFLTSLQDSITPANYGTGEGEGGISLLLANSYKLPLLMTCRLSPNNLGWILWGSLWRSVYCLAGLTTNVLLWLLTEQLFLVETLLKLTVNYLPSIN